MRARRLFLGLALSLALIAACAAPEPTTTPIPPTPVPAPTKPPAPTAPTNTVAPTAAPAPTKLAEPTKPAEPAKPTAPIATAAEPTKPAAPATTPAEPTKPAAPTVASATPGVKPVAGPRTWKVDAENTQVELKVNEQFANLPAPNDAVLTTKAITGQVVVAPDGKIQEGSKLTVDLRQLKSDREQRDRFIRNNTLESDKYPNAEFTPTELRGLSNPLPTAGEFKGQLVGTMRVHDTTKPVTFELTGRIEGNTVKGTARTEVKITDFGMSVPRVAILLSVQDLVRMQVDFTATT